jgi:uncharacterized protein YegL
MSWYKGSGSGVRRLPVYLLLETSGGMKGESIEALEAGLQVILASLRQDPFALESVYLSIIAFDREVRVLVPLQGLEDVEVPGLQPTESGADLGAALEVLCQEVDANIRRNTDEHKGDWRPLLFLMIDGAPSDIAKYRNVLPEVKKRNFAVIVGCTTGIKAAEEYLLELTDRQSVVSLDTMDAGVFRQFFKWVSASISTGNMSMGASGQVALAAPPPEVHRLAG